MTQLEYTSIPDTSDAHYWEANTHNTQERSRTFVPRDKELHRRLKQQAWNEIQSRVRTPYKDRNKVKD